MKKKLFIKLLCTVFASSFLIMACQPTKEDNVNRRQTMRSTRSQQMNQEPRKMMDDNQRMPMKKQYNDDSCCPKTDCCPKSDCEWCKPKCEDTAEPQGIYAPMEPKKKPCPECPKDDCCDPCDSCGCNDCGCDPCDSCDSCGCEDSCCDPCDSCGCEDSCCDPCDSCGCNDCGCDDCGCNSCCPDGREYTRDEIFGRDTNERHENRNDPRRYREN